MDIQTLIERNKDAVKAHDTHVAATNETLRRREIRERLARIRDAKAVWRQLGVNEDELNDDGVLSINGWAVEIRTGLLINVMITPVLKNDEWKIITAAEDAGELLSAGVHMGWLCEKHLTDEVRGKMIAFIRDTLPEMPQIIRQQLREATAWYAKNGGAK